MILDKYQRPDLSWATHINRQRLVCNAIITHNNRMNGEFTKRRRCPTTILKQYLFYTTVEWYSSRICVPIANLVRDLQPQCFYERFRNGPRPVVRQIRSRPCGFVHLAASNLPNSDALYSTHQSPYCFVLIHVALICLMTATCIHTIRETDTCATTLQHLDLVISSAISFTMFCLAINSVLTREHANKLKV